MLFLSVKKYDRDGRHRSLLPLDHDDVVSEFGLHRRIGVDRVSERRHRQREGSVLERADHGTAGHPAERSSGPERRSSAFRCFKLYNTKCSLNAFVT